MNSTNQLLKIDQYIVDTSKLLGKGSNGTVYDCKIQNQSETLYCCKLINIDKIKSESQQEYDRADREVQILQHLKDNIKDNQNVVQLFQACKEKINGYEHLVLIMEKCDQDLRDYLLKNQIDQNKALLILRQIINGYKVCYQNQIMHRDIKPANILIKKEVFKLSDFGEGKITEQLNEQILQTNTGTFVYASPQINLLGLNGYSSKTDIYSLGVVFYELLYGKLPFAANKQAIFSFQDKILKTKQFTPLEKGVKGEIITQDIKLLLKQMITYEESDRISWEELFQHKLIKLEVPKIIIIPNIPKINMEKPQNQIQIGPSQFNFVNKQASQQKLEQLKKYDPNYRDHSRSLFEIKPGLQTAQPIQQQQGIKQKIQIGIFGNSKNQAETSKSQELSGGQKFMIPMVSNDDNLQLKGQYMPLRSDPIKVQQKDPKNSIQQDFNKKQFFSGNQLNSPKEISNQTLQNDKQKFHTLPNADSDFQRTNHKIKIQNEYKTGQIYILRGLKFIKSFKKSFEKIGNQNIRLEESVVIISDLCEQLIRAICHQINERLLNKPVFDTQFNFSEMDLLLQDQIYLKYKSTQRQSMVQKSIADINELLIKQLQPLLEEFPLKTGKKYSDKYVRLVQSIRDIIIREIRFVDMASYFVNDNCFGILIQI